MNRSDIFDTAKSHTTKDRAATHGEAENSFQQIADYWNVYLKHVGLVLPDSIVTPALDKNLGPKDVAVMMALFKVARSDSNPSHLDNWIDLVGYAGIAGEICTPTGMAREKPITEELLLPNYVRARAAGIGQCVQRFTEDCKYPKCACSEYPADQRQRTLAAKVANREATTPLQKAAYMNGVDCKDKGTGCTYPACHCINCIER